MLGGMGARPIGSHGHYPAKHFAVPAAVAAAARDGLALRKRFGRGGTDVGIARARQLASGSPRVTLRDIVYIRSYLRRHVVDNLGEKNPPSNGWIAWQLWGGWPAKKWAERIYNEAKRKGWIVRRNPAPRAGDDAAFFRDVDVALRTFTADGRARALLRANRFAAWDNGGCLALQQALLLFFEDALEADPALDAVVDVQPGYIVSPGLTEHALVWVEREGAEPLAIDSTGVKPGLVSARDWQQRRAEDDRELMTVLFDEMPEPWFAEWRARIADDDLVASTLILFTETFMKVQSKQSDSSAPRANPFDARGMPTDGGREPYLLVRCVNGVIESKLDASRARTASPADVSSAHAICTAQLQKSGMMKGGKLTAKGRRKNERIFAEEQGTTADRRLREYDAHLAESRTARSALSKKGKARRNPDDKKGTPPTQLMIVAAPLIAGNDPDRLEEAAKIVAGEMLSIPLYDGFWEPLVVARGNIVKMMDVVDREVPSELRLDGRQLLLEAIRQRALDTKIVYGNRHYDERHQSLNWMTKYIAKEYDALLAFWLLVDLMVINRSRTPGYEGLQLVVEWARGERGASVKELPVPTIAPDAVTELIRGANYVMKYNAVPWDAVLAVTHDLVGAVSRKDIQREELAHMAANRVVSAPPFLFSNAFDKTRRRAPSFHVTGQA